MDKAKGVIKKAAGKLPGVETKETEERSAREAGSSAAGNKEYFKKLIKETNERSRSRG